MPRSLSFPLAILQFCPRGSNERIRIAPSRGIRQRIRTRHTFPAPVRDRNKLGKICPALASGQMKGERKQNKKMLRNAGGELLARQRQIFARENSCVLARSSLHSINDEKGERLIFFRIVRNFWAIRIISTEMNKKLSATRGPRCLSRSNT